MKFQPNSLYYGDCLDVMREWPSACVDLVYLDPPFKSDQNYNILFGSSSGGGGAQMIAFEDTWSWDDAAIERVLQLEKATAHLAHKAIVGLHAMLGDCGMVAYLSYMAERLVEIRRVVKDSGSVYLHCDPSASHYLKALMDAIFGANNFRNEIVWRQHNAHNSSERFGPIHQIILFYAKSSAYEHRKVYTPYTKEYVDSYYRQRDDEGRRYRGSDLHGSGTRGGMSGKPWQGYDPTAYGRHWAVPGKLISEPLIPC